MSQKNFFPKIIVSLIYHSSSAKDYFQIKSYWFAFSTKVHCRCNPTPQIISFPARNTSLNLLKSVNLPDLFSYPFDATIYIHICYAYIYTDILNLYAYAPLHLNRQKQLIIKVCWQNKWPLTLVPSVPTIVLTTALGKTSRQHLDPVFILDWLPYQG